MLRIEYRATGAIDWLFAAHVGCSGTGVTENCPKVVGPDWAIPMSPMLKRRRDGRTLIVVSTKPGDVLALDAAQRGAPVWRMNVVGAPPVPAGEGNRGTAWGGALDDDNAYFGLNDDGIAAVSLTDGTRVWYKPLNATGDKKITHSAAATVIPGVVFIGGSDGRL